MSKQPPKYNESNRMRGFGDFVAKVVKPVVIVSDSVLKTRLKGCKSCRQRQERLNKILPFM